MIIIICRECEDILLAQHVSYIRLFVVLMIKNTGKHKRAHGELETPRLPRSPSIAQALAAFMGAHHSMCLQLGSPQHRLHLIPEKKREICTVLYLLNRFYIIKISHKENYNLERPALPQSSEVTPTSRKRREVRKE